VRVIVKEISTEKKQNEKIERPTEEKKRKKKVRNNSITVLFLSLIKIII